MMRFATLLKHPADWMTGSDDAENRIVLTSRIRLARNLRMQPFPGWSTEEHRRAVLEQVQPAVEALPEMKGGFSEELTTLNPLQKQVLVERHLISREHAARGAGAAAVIQRSQNFSIMINEEDHLRMQAIRPGLDLVRAFDELSEVDDFLEERLDYAYHPQFGYLTTCPSNLGTGLRASAMLHLPGLVLSGQISPVLHAVTKLGLAVRGIYGEGTESLANLYQISNQSTLGESETEIIARMERIVFELEQHEANAREKFREDEPMLLVDRIGRAYGILRNAHVMESKEALSHISTLRLGADLGYFSRDTFVLCDSLLMDIQPAHLQWGGGKKLNPVERDLERAKIMRERLQNLSSPV